MNAVQGVDFLMAGFQSGIGALAGSVQEHQAASAHVATIRGYNNLVERYNTLLSTSTDVTQRLKKALDSERAENARLRRLLK